MLTEQYRASAHRLLAELNVSQALVENLSKIPGVKAKVGGVSIEFSIDDEPVIEQYLPPVEIHNPPEEAMPQSGWIFYVFCWD